MASELPDADPALLEAAAAGDENAAAQLMEQGWTEEQVMDLVSGVAEAELELLGEAEDGDAAAPEVDNLPGDEPGEGDEAAEHLKDAIDGSLRLKRMLSRDEETDPSGKKQKTGEGCVGAVEKVKTAQLLTKWGMPTDADTRHVVENLALAEIEHLLASAYVPNKFDDRKSCAEQVTYHTLLLREKACPAAYAVDVLAAFKFKWKLTLEQDKALRQLCHKDLRYVIERYDGTAEILEHLIEEAKESPEDEDTALGALPENPGVRTMGRFQRLDLIDPLADAVVFGDANLTFSIKLAKHRKALGHVGRVIATTFEQLDTLKERYKEIAETIKTLEEYCAEVLHGVDCTRIAVDPQFKDLEGSFGAVYYNYPHAGAVSGFFDGHPLVNWRHENLMRLFFRALRFFVKPGGTVKVASNANAVGVRYSYIIGGAVENEFQHVETFPFLEWCMHRYGRSYGDRRDTYKRPEDGGRYNAQRAEGDMVYCFQYAPTDEELPQQEIRRPPTLKTLLASNDGPFRNVPPGPGKERQAQELYNRFVSECSGVHVG